MFLQSKSDVELSFASFLAMVPSLRLDFYLPLLKYFLGDRIHFVDGLEAGKFIVRKKTFRAELSHLVAISVEDYTKSCSVEIEKRNCQLQRRHFFRFL
jgi:hypothetical protein